MSETNAKIESMDLSEGEIQEVKDKMEREYCSECFRVLPRKKGRVTSAETRAKISATSKKSPWNLFRKQYALDHPDVKGKELFTKASVEYQLMKKEKHEE